MADADSVTPSPTATELVHRCLDGDQSAWQQLVRRYARLVHVVPIRHGLSSAEAEDVGQEVFLALAQHLHQLDDPERLPGWLVTTARRLSWRAVQRRRQEQPLAQADLADETEELTHPPLVSQLPSMAELLAGWSRQEALTNGMAHLSQRCHQLLTLIFLDPQEPDYDQISAALDMPKGSIGPTRNRCLQQLRAILDGLGFGPS